MRRRDFVLTSAALAAGSAGVFLNAQRMSASVEYPGHFEGHWLRDVQHLPERHQQLAGAAQAARLRPSVARAAGMAERLFETRRCRDDVAQLEVRAAGAWRCARWKFGAELGPANGRGEK